jgi:hypothetical protein
MVIFPSSLRFAEPSLLSRTDSSIRRGQSAMSASLIQATMALLLLVASSSSSSISPLNAASHPVASSTATHDPRRRRQPSPHLYPRRFASAEDVAMLHPPPPILIPHGRHQFRVLPPPPVHTFISCRRPTSARRRLPPCRRFRLLRLHLVRNL